MQQLHVVEPAERRAQIADDLHLVDQAHAGARTAQQSRQEFQLIRGTI